MTKKTGISKSGSVTVITCASNTALMQYQHGKPVYIYVDDVPQLQANLDSAIDQAAALEPSTIPVTLTQKRQAFLSQKLFKRAG